jgi:hypothetical protein
MSRTAQLIPCNLADTYRNFGGHTVDRLVTYKFQRPKTEPVLQDETSVYVLYTVSHHIPQCCNLNN